MADQINYPLRIHEVMECVAYRVKQYQQQYRNNIERGHKQEALIALAKANEANNLVAILENEFPEELGRGRIDCWLPKI